MPKKILTDSQAREILTKGKLMLLNAECNLSHSEILYKIVKLSIDLKCDFCQNLGTYLHYTIGHDSKKYIAITCDGCSPPGYQKYG